MRAIKNLVGNKYGMLTVIVQDGKDRNDNVIWKCQCECGGEISIRGFSLQSGNSKSCGCLLKEHGYSQTPEYRAWLQMKYRNYNKNHKRYKDYGGDGVTVCDRWLSSFDNFLEDMGMRPSDKHSLDRFPVTAKVYCKENCRWATGVEQSANKRKNLLRLASKE